MDMNARRRRLVAAAGAVALLGSAVRSRAGERVIPVVARKFVFEPGEIRLKKGETVVLQITAPEVPMGINVPDFGQRADIVPGRASTLRLTPDRAGRFTFVCDLFCGSGHEDMSGTLIVEE
jgi:cytochrome c oxidase subunit II